MITTYGDISPRTAGYAVRKLLERGQFGTVTERFGQVDPQGQNKTDTRKYRRYLSVARATAPLAEGITPAGQKLSYVDITCTLEQYGDLFPITDKIEDTHEDPVLNEAVKICGEQIAETVEVIRINVLKGGTTVFYANGVASRTLVTSPATKNDFRKIFRYLQNRKAKEISELIAATPDVATAPVAPAYFVMGHTDCLADLVDIPGFVKVENYSDAMKAMPFEVGKLDQFRFILTPLFEPWLLAATGASGSTYLTNGTKGTGYPDVYPLIIVARDAYAIVPLQGKSAVTPIVLNPKPAAGDPLGQRGSVAWKRYDTACILNQSWLVRLEVAATAL